MGMTLPRMYLPDTEMFGPAHQVTDSLPKTENVRIIAGSVCYFESCIPVGSVATQSFAVAYFAIESIIRKDGIA